MDNSAKEKTFKLVAHDGLHARPAGLFVKTVAPFQSIIEVEHKGMRKNGKSIMSLMSLGAAAGDELRVIATGEDAHEAISALTHLFDKNFVE